jgi:LysR family hydrogen peroxide-inducible transcriptional activator
MNDKIKTLPTIRQLRHLVALAGHGHFGRAAEACFVTQSTLSASIKALETVLGGTLFERTKRSVVITPLGATVLAHARTVLREAEDLIDAVGAAGEPLNGPLRLGVIPTISPFLLPRVSPTLRAAHPDLELYLREDQTAPLLERLAAGDLDALLLAFPYNDNRVETLIFADDPFWLAMPAGHSTAEHEHIAAAELSGETLLLLEEGHCLRDHVLGNGEIDAVNRVGAFQATSLQTLVQMVANGLGLTLLPKMAVDAGITRGTSVVTRPLAGRAVGRQIGLAWRRTSSRAADFTLLASFFRDELATPLRH